MRSPKLHLQRADSPVPAKQSPGSSEHGVQEGELIMSVLLILTLPRSVNIPSQESGDSFPEPSTQPCVSLLLGRSLWLPPRGKVWAAGHLLEKQEDLYWRGWRWSLVLVTLAGRRELGVFGDKRHCLSLAPYSSWVLSISSVYFQKDGFPLERNSLQLSLQCEGLILHPLLKICLLGPVFLC